MSIQPTFNGKRGVLVRGWAERIDDTRRFRFYCPKGHSQVESIDKGRAFRNPLLRISDAIVARFAVYWSKDHGGVSFYCKGCTKDLKQPSDRKSA